MVLRPEATSHRQPRAACGVSHQISNISTRTTAQGMFRSCTREFPNVRIGSYEKEGYSELLENSGTWSPEGEIGGEGTGERWSGEWQS